MWGVTWGLLTRAARGMSAMQRHAPTTMGVYHFANRITNVSIGDCRAVACPHQTAFWCD